jgi:hypothetical protein
MSKVLDLNRKDGLQFFYKLLQAIGISNADEIVNAAANALKTGSDNLLSDLEQRWYESVNSGQPNYGLYDINEYLTEFWFCYEVYSKKYLKEIHKEK